MENEGYKPKRRISPEEFAKAMGAKIVTDDSTLSPRMKMIKQIADEARKLPPK